MERLGNSTRLRTAVISQPMYFPWVGLLEQIRLADIFVIYDDVQLSRGFYNRVQVKTPQGTKWLTIPLRDYHRGQLINEVEIDNRVDWRGQHRDILKQNYKNSPYVADMLGIVDQVFSKPAKILADITCDSLFALSRYFNLNKNLKIIYSRDIEVSGASSQRLNKICLNLKANVYLTGHGAKNYLDHNLFEKTKVRVEYMKYRMIPYSQLHGEFTPYVSGLDLVANCGHLGSRVICSDSIYWKDFMHE